MGGIETERHDTIEKLTEPPVDKNDLTTIKEISKKKSASQGKVKWSKKLDGKTRNREAATQIEN